MEIFEYDYLEETSFFMLDDEYLELTQEALELELTYLKTNDEALLEGIMATVGNKIRFVYDKFIEAMRKLINRFKPSQEELKPEDKSVLGRLGQFFNELKKKIANVVSAIGVGNMAMIGASIVAIHALYTGYKHTADFNKLKSIPATEAVRQFIGNVSNGYSSIYKTATVKASSGKTEVLSKVQSAMVTVMSIVTTLLSKLVGEKEVERINKEIDDEKKAKAEKTAAKSAQKPSPTPTPKEQQPQASANNSPKKDKVKTREEYYKERKEKEYKKNRQAPKMSEEFYEKYKRKRKN